MSGTIFFTSQRNSMKRSIDGTVNVAAPTTSAYVLLYITNQTIAHNLGYVPIFEVQYEPFGDGTIWPPLSSRTNGNAQKPTNTSVQGPGLIAWADSTNLYIQLFASSNTFTGTFPVYYRVYKDYAL